jgi:hypothetical protein
MTSDDQKIHDAFIRNDSNEKGASTLGNPCHGSILRGAFIAVCFVLVQWKRGHNSAFFSLDDLYFLHLYLPLVLRLDERTHALTKTGYLTRMELQRAIMEVTGQEFTLDHVETLYTEFDKDENGKVDFPEIKSMLNFLLQQADSFSKKRPSVRMTE